MSDFGDFEKLAPNHGMLLNSILNDNLILFETEFKKNMANMILAEQPIFELICDSQSWLILCWWKENLSKFFNKMSPQKEKALFKNLFLSRLSVEEKMKVFWILQPKRASKIRRASLLITVWLYAPIVICNSVKSWKVGLKEEHIYYLFKFLDENWLQIRSIQGEEKTRYFLNQIWLLKSKHKLHIKHYLLCEGFTENIFQFKEDFYSQLNDDEKVDIFKYVIRSTKLEYYSSGFLYPYSKGIEKNTRVEGITIDFVSVFINHLFYPATESKEFLKRKTFKRLKSWANYIEKELKTFPILEPLYAWQELKKIIHNHDLMNALIKDRKKNRENGTKYIKHNIKKI